MEFLNLLAVPLFWLVWKIDKRLTRVETKLDVMCGKK